MVLVKFGYSIWIVGFIEVVRIEDFVIIKCGIGWGRVVIEVN